jgi:hypothetical protein
MKKNTGKTMKSSSLSKVFEEGGGEVIVQTPSKATHKIRRQESKSIAKKKGKRKNMSPYKKVKIGHSSLAPLNFEQEKASPVGHSPEDPESVLSNAISLDELRKPQQSLFTPGRKFDITVTKQKPKFNLRKSAFSSQFKFNNTGSIEKKGDSPKQSTSIVGELPKNTNTGPVVFKQSLFSQKEL